MKPLMKATGLVALATASITALAIGLAGCGPEQDYRNATCPPEGTNLTYETFGAQFLAKRCQTCHARNVANRHGAPDKYAFDGPADVHQWIDRIYDRSAGDNTSMPPGPVDPPLAERDALEEWLACGAP